MDNGDARISGESSGPEHAGYQPPRIEQVLTTAELEREVLYAGAPGPPSANPG